MSDDLNHKNGHTNRDEIDEFLSKFDSEEPSRTPDEEKISELEKITDDLSRTLNKTRIFKSEDIEKSNAATRSTSKSSDSEMDEFLSELPQARPSRVDRLNNGGRRRRSAAEDSVITPSKEERPVGSKPNGQEDTDPLWEEQMELPKLPKLNLLKGRKKQEDETNTREGRQDDQMASKGKKGKKKKKHRFNLKRLLVSLILLGVIVCMVGGIAVAAIIVSAETIYPDRLYEELPENSTVYARNGTRLESINRKEGMRTNLSYSEMPEQLVEAFISIEDKTFWDHHGFNFVRIAGAVVEKLKGSNRISGTSTITQQLARNVYLTDTKQDYSINRKIIEAYYAVELERKLSKDEIIAAYMNTIFLGNQSNGVQAAAKNYFNKDVWDLNLAECAVLASLAQAPHRFAPMKRDIPENVEGMDDDLIIHEDSFYVYYYNDNYRNRQIMVLDQMLDQGKITQQQYDEAVAYDIQGALRADQFMTTSLSSYFVDYALDQVVQDLMAEFGVDEEKATTMLYTRGYQIHTTLDPDIQEMVEGIFALSSNFPGATALNRDSEGNIRGKNNQILLLSALNYFASFTGEDERFLLNPDEYAFDARGNLTLYSGKRLNFSSAGDIEFKKLYYYDAQNVLTTMDGGTIHVAKEYKELDSNNNMVISAEFLQKNPGVFYKDSSSDSLVVPSSWYTLKAAVMQPQAAMVIIDHQTSEITAMVGGRSLGGRLLYNRATKPRQPGSSIKPISVYATALQLSAVEDYTNAEGKYWTAATGVEDSPTTTSGTPWPKNWYTGYKGMQTVRTAIEQSTNTVAVKVSNDIGYDNSVKMLEKLGVTTIEKTAGQANDLNPAAMALGGMTRGISPLEMAAAYTAFPNAGVYKEPIAYTKITTRKDEVIMEKIPETTLAMDPGVAWIMTDMLQTTVTSGLARGAKDGISAAVAGKTGTTSDNFDAWFVGFTPQYSAAVWIGNDVNIELTQGSAAARKVWNKVMRNIPNNRSSFPSAPSNVTSHPIDAVSGMLPTGFSTVRNEYFIVGTIPGAYDTHNLTKEVCDVTLMLPTPLCNTISKSNYDAETDTYWTPPTTYCPLHNPDPSLYPVAEPSTDDPDDPDSGTSEGSEGSTGNGDSGNGNSGNTDGDNNGEIPIVDTNDNEDEDAGASVPDWLNLT